MKKLSTRKFVPSFLLGPKYMYDALSVTDFHQSLLQLIENPVIGS